MRVCLKVFCFLQEIKKFRAISALEMKCKLSVYKSLYKTLGIQQRRHFRGCHQKPFLSNN
jgi:hypothetical protein